MTKNTIPVISSTYALKSLRDSGYTIEAALGEVIDNSIEAHAKNITIKLIEGANSKGKKCVSDILIIDDGEGMHEDILEKYPQIGYSTRYHQVDTIGKYGVGAKLAALNFSKKFEVWSKTKKDKHWNYVYYDLDENLENINPVIVKPLPSEVDKSHLRDQGTIIKWSKIDRLEEGRHAKSFIGLKQHIEKELSRIFRYYIDWGTNITIEGKPLLPFDPLYQITKSFNNKMIQKHWKSLSIKNENLKKKVKPFYESKEIANKSFTVNGSEVEVTIVLYPPEVTRQRGMGGDEFSKKLLIPDNEGSISFIRLNREVSYTNVPRIFPTGVKEKDRFIGIEVAFTPELDEYFGVRNVKRGVEPHGVLRDKIRAILKEYLPTARKELDNAWGKAEKEGRTATGEHSKVTNAAKQANKSLPKGAAKGKEDKAEEDQIIDDLATDVVGDNKEKKQSYKSKIEDNPFVIESVSIPGKQFFDIIHLSDKFIIRVNTRHRFYREVWSPLKSIAEMDSGSITGEDAKSSATRAIESLTLLLLAYGKAESMHSDPEEQYRDLTGFWGQFLDTMMKKVQSSY